MFKKFDKRKLLAVICGGVLLAGYLGGFLKILLDDANVDLNPIHCMAAGWTSTKGRMWICSRFGYFSFLRHRDLSCSGKPLQMSVVFELSDQGTRNCGYERRGTGRDIKGDKT